MEFIILTEPRTKKTGNQATVQNGRMRVFPNKLYQAFEKECIKQIREQNVDSCEELWGDASLHVCVKFYNTTHHKRDLNNLQQAIADTLQKAGVIKNDCLIESWDGSRKMYDKDKPRLEIVIEPFIT